jgi:hypothetical protein
MDAVLLATYLGHDPCPAPGGCLKIPTETLAHTSAVSWPPVADARRRSRLSRALQNHQEDRCDTLVHLRHSICSRSLCTSRNRLSVAAGVEEELDDWSHPGVHEEDEEMLLDV